jgi:hypothetical protein
MGEQQTPASVVAAALSAIEGGGGSSAAPIPTEHPWPLVVALCESLILNNDPPRSKIGPLLDAWADYARAIIATPPTTPIAGGFGAVPQPNREG